MKQLPPRQWKTQQLISALAALQIGEYLTYSVLATASQEDADSTLFRGRLYRARARVLREHHVLIEIVRTLGARRIAQESVTQPVASQKTRIHNSALRGQGFIRDGVTDWNALPPAVKTRVLTETAILGAITQATKAATTKRVAAAVEANGILPDLTGTLALFQKR